MSQELLPCGHCGHKANLIDENSFSIKKYYYAVCEFCNIKTSYERSKDIAIKLWNKRVTTDERDNG